MSKGTRKYFKKKILWFLVTLVVAVLLNFFLPRLMSGAGTPSRYDPQIINAVNEQYGYRRDVGTIEEEGKTYIDADEWNGSSDEACKKLFKVLSELQSSISRLQSRIRR